MQQKGFVETFRGGLSLGEILQPLVHAHHCQGVALAVAEEGFAGCRLHFVGERGRVQEHRFQRCSRDVAVRARMGAVLYSCSNYGPLGTVLFSCVFHEGNFEAHRATPCAS